MSEIPNREVKRFVEHLNENLASDAEGYRDAAVPNGLLEMVETNEQLDRIETALKEATDAADPDEVSK